MLTINKDPGILEIILPKNPERNIPKLGYPKNPFPKPSLVGILKRVLLKLTFSTDFSSSSSKNFHLNLCKTFRCLTVRSIIYKLKQRELYCSRMLRNSRISPSQKKICSKLLFRHRLKIGRSNDRATMRPLKWHSIRPITSLFG